MIYIGIDPGAKGGVAYINGHGAAAFPFSPKGIIDILMLLELEEEEKICCLEEVHAMPKQGVSSTFKFGENYGYIRGVIEAFGIPYQTVTPQRWKKEFGLNSDKKNSIEICKRLFPKVNLKATERSRVDSDGMAEALLMAEYARRKL